MKTKLVYTIAGIIIGIYGIIKLVNLLTPDPVKDDLLSYINDNLIPAEKNEHLAITAYNAVSGVHYTDDKTMTDSLLQIIIPKYSEFHRAIIAMKPTTKEVQALHAIYRIGADTEMAGFRLLETAIEKEDSVQAGEAGRMIQSGDKMILSFDHSLDSLAESHDVEITRKKIK